MQKRIIVLFVFLIIHTALTHAQHNVILPGYTGYAVPAEYDEETIFAESKGLYNWTNPHQQIEYHLNFRNTGSLHINIIAKNNQGNSKLQFHIADKNFKVLVSKSNHFKQIPVGDLIIEKPGFYTIQIQALAASSKKIAEIESLQLSGSAAEDVHFNKKPRRNAASVHLHFPIPDSIKAVQFYNEVTVPAGADIVNSYFMACGFARGYFGIQVNGPTERRVIFSVWDAGNEAVDRNKVADTNKVRLLAKGEDVEASDFGNEGTGGHSHWVFNWKAEQTYKFLVNALPDSASGTTIYTGYFFAPELNAWKLIASFSAPKDGHHLSHLYSFVEDFSGINGQLYRKAFFGNQWIADEEKKFTELTQAKFTCDATGRANDRLDFGGGEEQGLFYLWNGGFVSSHTKYGDVFARSGIGKKPEINLYHHIDSLVQHQKDLQQIYAAVAAGKIDTTGSINNIFYQIIKEGTGEYVALTDTVRVFYKGSLFTNGNLFDETKTEPVSFPLSRLIKGWQIGLQQCGVGGKIKLIIPSAQGYSIRSRSKDIPPNSVLVFEIEVVGVKK